MIRVLNKLNDYKSSSQKNSLNVTTISMPKELAEELDRLAAQKSMTRSELVRKMKEADSQGRDLNSEGLKAFF